MRRVLTIPVITLHPLTHWVIYNTTKVCSCDLDLDPTNLSRFSEDAPVDRK